MTITCCCCWWRCNLPSSTSRGWIPDTIHSRRVRSESLFGQRINPLDSMLLFLIVDCADSSLCLAFWCGTICLIRCRFVLDILPARSEYSFRFSLPCLSSLRFGWNGKITLSSRSNLTSAARCVYGTTVKILLSGNFCVAILLSFCDFRLDVGYFSLRAPCVLDFANIKIKQSSVDLIDALFANHCRKKPL